jgi:hypothetical protein
MTAARRAGQSEDQVAEVGDCAERGVGHAKPAAHPLRFDHCRRGKDALALQNKKPPLPVGHGRHRVGLLTNVLARAGFYNGHVVRHLSEFL